MKLANRFVVTVKPAQPMIDWVRQVDIDMGFDPVEEETIRNNCNAYMVPDLDPPDRARRYLEDHAVEVFEQELGMWFTKPELWPETRDLATFLEWFDLELHEMCFDLGSEPLGHQDWF